MIMAVAGRASKRPIGSARRRVWLARGVVLLATAVVVVPFLDLVFTSLKTGQQYGNVDYSFIPRPFTLENYQAVVRNLDLPLLFRNSIEMAGAVTILVLVTSNLAGYALAKLRFRGRDGIFRFVLATMMFPQFLFLIPNFLILVNFPLANGNNVLGRGDAGGLAGTVWGLILPFACNGFGIFLMRQFIRDIPEELLEAARIDGASELRLWWSVIVPQTKAVSATLVVLMFTQVWNEYIWSLLIYTVNGQLATLPVGIQALVNANNPSAGYPVICAGLVISLLPVLILFVFLQRYYVNGFLISGLK